MGPASGLFIGSDDTGPVDNAGLGACTGHRFTPLTRTHREPNRQGRKIGLHSFRRSQDLCHSLNSKAAETNKSKRRSTSANSKRIKIMSQRQINPPLNLIIDAVPAAIIQTYYFVCPRHRNPDLIEGLHSKDYTRKRLN